MSYEDRIDGLGRLCWPLVRVPCPGFCETARPEKKISYYLMEKYILRLVRTCGLKRRLPRRAGLIRREEVFGLIRDSITENVKASAPNLSGTEAGLRVVFSSVC